MKAIVQERYGPPDEVLELRDVPKSQVADGEVLVSVEAASVNPADWHFIRGVPYIARLSVGLRAPKDSIPGCDMSGRVEAVGAGVTAFKPGDDVYASAFAHGSGAFAERASVGQELLAAKPAGLSFEQAAAVPLAGMTALQGLRDHGRVQPGQSVLIVGASGGVGTFAVRIAKALGAEVTGVCSGGSADLVRSLGADHVIDYAAEDFTDGARRYDVVFQLGGTKPPAASRKALTPKGTLVLSSGESSGRWIGPLTRVLQATAMRPFVGQRMVSFTVAPNGRDLEELRRMIEGGDLSPVMDRTFSLSEVPDAIRHLEEGHPRGKIAIAV